MNIGSFDIDARVLVVAEIGNNHEGRFETAHELVRRAADAGAGAAKFQTFRTKRFVRPSEAERFARMKSFELTSGQFAELAVLARERGLLFLSTPLDLESVDVLEPLVDAYKIASGDITFLPLLDAVARTGKPVILSTGASTLDESERAVSRLRDRGVRDLAVLHCVSASPAPPDQANLAAIGLLAERLACPAGWSDHVFGIDVAAAAVAAGARIVEKHFTLDKAFSDFRDHALSADPPEFRRLADVAADPRKAPDPAPHLGRREKAVQPCERDMVRAIRRSIVAGADLPEGRVLAWNDLGWMRPADGLPPGEEGRILGRRLRMNVKLGDTLTEAMVQ